MGFFFSNLHIRIKDESAKCQIPSLFAELLGTQGFRAVQTPQDADLTVSVFDAGGTWVSVCSDGLEFDTEESSCGLVAPLSRQLETDVLTVSCYDSDCLLLNLQNCGSGIDAWAKVGRYPGLKRRSSPAAWKGLVSDLDRWKAALRAEYIFAEDSLAELEPLLGLENGQGRFCAELMQEELFGQAQTLYFALPETADKPQSPRLTMPTFDLMPCKMGESKIISALNTGGKSMGLAVVFSGSYVEREEISFRDVQLEYGFDRYPRPAIPLTLEKRQTVDGQWVYYAEAPQFPIPPSVKEGLPVRKAMDEEFKRKFGVRFTPVGNERKRLDITVHLIPLKNPEGQCGWRVWLMSRSKRAFLEQHNKTWENSGAYGAKLLNPDDFDLDD